MVMTHPSLSPQLGGWGWGGGMGEFTEIEGQTGKNMCQGGKPDTGKSSYIGMNACGSAYENGCVVDGTCAMAAY